MLTMVLLLEDNLISRLSDLKDSMSAYFSFHTSCFGQNNRLCNVINCHYNTEGTTSGVDEEHDILGGVLSKPTGDIQQGKENSTESHSPLVDIKS